MGIPVQDLKYDIDWRFLLKSLYSIQIQYVLSLVKLSGLLIVLCVSVPSTASILLFKVHG